jgi:hypothetical protein
VKFTLVWYTAHKGGDMSEEQQHPIEEMAERSISAFQPVTEMIERLFTVYGEAGNAMMQTFAHALKHASQDSSKQEN